MASETIICKKEIQNYQDGHIDGVGLVILECSQICVIDSFESLLV